MWPRLPMGVGRPPHEFLTYIRNLEAMTAFEAAPVVVARLGCQAQRVGGYAAGAGLDLLHVRMLHEIYLVPKSSHSMHLQRGACAADLGWPTCRRGLETAV